jgi:hypothetical protein
MAKIELELSELKELLNLQRQSCAQHISRNLSIYSFECRMIDKVKVELQEEARKSPYPEDFKVLSKYLK